MNKIRVLFLGSRPLGKKVLEFLLLQPDVEVVGMIVQDPSHGSYWSEDPRDLPVRRFGDISEAERCDFDLGLSVNYWKLIKEPLLSRPRLGFLNVHHSYNLRLRGRNTTTFAILRARQDRIWHHGSTLHYITRELDAGDIVSSVACPISETDTAFSLFARVESSSLQMLKEWVGRVWRERIIAYKPPSEYHEYHNSDLVRKEINLEMEPIEVYDIVRAFWFPPLEPPYTVLDGQKVVLTTLPEFGNKILIDAGENRRVYTVDT